MRDAFALLTTFGRRGGALRANALPWFPFVGFVLGTGVGVVWWVADQWWPAPVAAVIAVTADLVMTGMLHADGLADTADGLLPHATRERRLEIMHTPDVGAFGIVAVAVAIAARGTALASMPARVVLVAALWCAARAIVAAAPRVVPYARESGMAAPLLDGAHAWPASAVVPAAALATLVAGRAGLAAVLCGTAAGIATIAFARRRLGGFTGDVLGASIVVTETIGLVVAAAKW